MSCRNLSQVVLLVCSLLSPGNPANALTRQDMSPTARAYLQAALDIIQNKSLRKKQVDWDALRRETFARATGAEQTVDTYEAIRFALRAIGDNHSFLQLTGGICDGQAAVQSLILHRSQALSGRRAWRSIPRRRGRLSR
jgi:hypothetical protein